MKAIDEDKRSDRAISLAAGLGPNFVGQLRGTKSIPPKKPSIEYVRKLAQALGKELSEIIGDTEDDAEERLRAALLAYGVHENLLDAAMLAIQGFRADSVSAVQSQPRHAPAETAPANRRRTRVPSE